MYTSFGPDAVGVDCQFPEAAALAAETGFDAVQIDLGYLREHGPDDYRAVLDDHDLRAGSATLPVDVTGDAETYGSDLDALDGVAEAAATVGCTRISTYLMSFSDERPFEENFAFHRDRLEPVAEILADHGIDLGLEFLGPETLREGHEHEFISTAEGMLDLCDAVGDNAGLLLDSWHWHTAGGAVDALESLDADDIVDVHVNDAPEGLGVDEYVDTERALPGATGVIDIERFLSHLDAVGYDGPVIAEPFSDELEAMADADAARETAASLELVFDRAGV
ncbi:sugar phosphate isomerase/epimerase [Halosimplex rubrum]|uniref:Sugar phosphate isomerase/epimerase n=1 Tax=Halosimplex rubrum TaxID=869889 RepID=A0A7D5TK75_9EURY|nr:sugar phosphate isomerase/epimerase family protein [Halosimplex rubrum]QLH76492.1 sugar phosphate isomerase/epimerase [Halosimplex rubrum]